MEADLKTQTVAYNNVKSSLQILEHKLEWVTSVTKSVKAKSHFINYCVKRFKWNLCLYRGNLLNRSMSEIVKKEDLIVSEYLTTVLVVVTKSVTQWECLCVCTYSCNVLHVWNVFLKYVFRHRANYSQWERTYESMSEFVVPRSSRWAVFIHFWPWDKPFHLIHVQVPVLSIQKVRLSNHRCSITAESESPPGFNQ